MSKHILCWGYLLWLEGTYLGQGVPTLDRGYPPWPGGTHLGWGVPTLPGIGYPPLPDTCRNNLRHTTYTGGNKKVLHKHRRLTARTAYQHSLLCLGVSPPSHPLPRKDLGPETRRYPLPLERTRDQCPCGSPPPPLNRQTPIKHILPSYAGGNKLIWNKINYEQVSGSCKKYGDRVPWCPVLLN